MTTNTPETTQKIDYFPLLPNELVQLIADHLHETPITPPIPLACQRFLVPHLRQRYKNVQISTYSNLARFFETLASKPLGGLVARLEIKISEDPDASDETLDNSLATANRGLQSLICLRILSINGSERLWDLVLKPESPFGLKLQSVHLYSVAAFQDRNALDPMRFANLARYPNLSRLAIYEAPILSVSVDSHPDETEPHSPDLVHFASLTSLSINGALSRFSHPGRLLKCCSPSSLIIKDLSASPKVVDVLETAQEPEKVSMLSLLSFGSLPSVRYLDVLRRFNRIHTLSLAVTCVLSSHEYYDTLAILPLRTLTFFLHCSISATGVLGLVEGRSRSPTLLKLVLDHVQATEGTFAKSRDDTDWKLPVWDISFTRSQAQAVREAGRRGGVEVAGKAFEAMEIEDRFEEIMASL
ncbi:hypothetical protein JCM5353_000537 [Sporobolomyces roseus]